MKKKRENVLDCTENISKQEEREIKKEVALKGENHFNLPENNMLLQPTFYQIFRLKERESACEGAKKKEGLKKPYKRPTVFPCLLPNAELLYGRGREKMAPGSHLLVLLPTAVVQLNPLWPLPHAPSQPVMLGDSRVVVADTHTHTLRIRFPTPMIPSHHLPPSIHKTPRAK
jgi:hypothetical protein